MIGFYAIDEIPIDVLADEDDSFVESALSLILQDPDLTYQYLAIISPFFSSPGTDVELPSAIMTEPIMVEIGDVVDVQSSRIYLSNCPFYTSSLDPESGSSTAMLLAGPGGAPGSSVLLISPGGGAILIAP